MHSGPAIAAVTLLCWLPCTAQGETRAIAEAVVPLAIHRDAVGDRCKVTQDNRVILDIDCDAAALPQVIRHFTDNIAPLRQILVLEEVPGGNACDGGPKHVLVIGADGNARHAGRIDWCGGPAPVFARAGRRIVITQPAHPPRRGEGIIPMQQHFIDDGTLNRRVHLRTSGDGRARTLDPAIDGPVQALRNLGMKAELRGDFADAASRYLAAWQLLPTPRVVWDTSEILALNLVEVHARQQNFAEALKWLEQADLSSQNMTNAGPTMWYGRIKLEQGDMDEAFLAFDSLHRAWGTRLFVGHPEKYLAFYQGEKKKRKP